MYRLSVFLIFFLSCCFYSFSQSSIEFTEEEKQWIANNPSIVFGYDPNWPPFEMYENGEYSGIVGDFVKIIERETGINMIPSPPMQWKETLSKFKKGQLKVLTSVSVQQNKNNQYAFTEPFIIDPLVIVTRKGYKSIVKLADVNTDRIAVPKGYMRKNVLEEDFPNAARIYTDNVQECLELINEGEADIFVGSHKVIEYYVNELGYKNLEFQATPNGRFLKLCFGLTKETEVFRNIIQKVLDNMSDYDKYRINAKWVALRYNQGVEKSELRRYVFIGGGVFLLAMFLFYIWNKTLRKQIKYRLNSELELKKTLALIKEKNTEKDILLKEIHHRVKNNLQIVYSMLNMQSREVENTEALKIISEGKSRVMAMALIHKILYESDKLDRVDLDSYIKSLLNNISKIYDSNTKVTVKLETNTIQLDLDKAIPLGLILNELLTNSFKHAFAGKESGEISIILERESEIITFNYQDNGVGLNTNDLESFTSLGMKLVKRLANQVQTQANLESKQGIRVWFSFKR